MLAGSSSRLERGLDADARDPWARADGGRACASGGARADRRRRAPSLRERVRARAACSRARSDPGPARGRRCASQRDAARGSETLDKVVYEAARRRRCRSCRATSCSTSSSAICRSGSDSRGGIPTISRGVLLARGRSRARGPLPQLGQSSSGGGSRAGTRSSPGPMRSCRAGRRSGPAAAGPRIGSAACPAIVAPRAPPVADAARVLPPEPRDIRSSRPRLSRALARRERPPR